MTATAVIVGLNAWDRFTRPCIDSLLDTNISINILCVDNGSEPQYPQHKPCYTMVHASKKQSYAAGLNLGLHHAKPSDWYILTNNDVIFHEPIFDKLHALSPDNLYGFMLYPDIFKEPYLSGWCYFLSDKILQKVGVFDEKFTPMWFEDADYSIRCIRAGFGLVELTREDYGIEHLERAGERAPIIHQSQDSRNRNREYLRRKHGV